jgi:nicotinate-nucleotide adenylyltransferase
VPEPKAGLQRIGVFGSAFNPPQIAHLALVNEATGQLGLDRVVVVPTGDAYHKEKGSDPGPELRLAMARVAFADVERVVVSATEVERAGPSYTCVTIEEISDEYPDSEIHLLMGADAALSFGQWMRPEAILKLARVAVAPRADTDEEQVRAAFDRLGAGDRVDLIDMPAVNLSSSAVREFLADGRDVADMVPAAVLEIIDNEGLYGAEQ